LKCLKVIGWDAGKGWYIFRCYENGDTAYYGEDPSEINSGSGKCGVRPVITLDAKVLNGKTQSGLINDPIIVN